MELAVGEIVEGKVTGITKFGAFLALPGGKTGMVHISEIAHTYVSDINEHLSVGQEVKAKIISIDPAGKINLSIKKATEAPQRQAKQDRSGRHPKNTAAAKEPQTFDDMVKQFMADSDSRISSIKQYSDHRTKNKRH